jgi:hypothetical protein
MNEWIRLKSTSAADFDLSGLNPVFHRIELISNMFEPKHCP